MYNQKKTLAFQVFCQGREYRIYTEGCVEGFKEVIEGPLSLRDAPNPIIINHYPKLLSSLRVVLMSESKLASPTNNAKSLFENRSSFGGIDGGVARRH